MDYLEQYLLFLALNTPASAAPTTAKISSLFDSMGCFKSSKEDEDEKVRREANKRIEKQLQKDKQTYRATHRLLLLGWFILVWYICSVNEAMSGVVFTGACAIFMYTRPGSY